MALLPNIFDATFFLVICWIKHPYGRGFRGNPILLVIIPCFDKMEPLIKFTLCKQNKHYNIWKRLCWLLRITAFGFKLQALFYQNEFRGCYLFNEKDLYRENKSSNPQKPMRFVRYYHACEFDGWFRFGKNKELFEEKKDFP